MSCMLDWILVALLVKIIKNRFGTFKIFKYYLCTYIIWEGGRNIYNDISTWRHLE